MENTEVLENNEIDEGNEVLERNVAQIAKYNKPLAEKILNHVITSNDYHLDYTKCDDLNLYVKGVPLHDEVDPIEQAKKIFDKTHKDGHLHVIFGIGLGYLFARFLKELNHKILVYEPNLDILRITLGLIDFSDALANPKVRIVHDKFHLKADIEALNQKDDLFTVYFLPSYRTLYNDELQAFAEDLTAIHGLIHVGFKELARQSRIWGINTLNNLKEIYKKHEFEALNDTFKGKPAIVVSAGPSLYKNIETIKTYKDKVVIICVGVALKALLNAGIKPDF